MCFICTIKKYSYYIYINKNMSEIVKLTTIVENNHSFFHVSQHVQHSL